MLGEMSHQTQENDPALIALTTMLDRAINPRDSLTLEIKPHGLFGLPEDLVKSHETNTFFLWRAKMFGKTVDLGKFVPRELTEEELEAQKTKKKPDPKAKPAAGSVTEKPVDSSLAGLSSEERRFKEMEDKFKNPSIKWSAEDIAAAQAQQPGVGVGTKEPSISKPGPPPVTTAALGRGATLELAPVAPPVDVSKIFTFTLEGAELAELEDAIQQGHATFRLERYPNMSEDELGKLKKKLKGPALRELKTLVCEVKVDFRPLQAPGAISTVARAQVKQLGDFTSEEECIEFKFGTGCYLKVELQAKNGEMFTPQIKELFPKVVDLSEQFTLPTISSRVKAEANFNRTLEKSLLTITADYRAAVKDQASEREEMEKMTQHKRNQMLQNKAKRKVEYVKKFIEKEKYIQLRKSLTPAILQILHDKLEKEMTGDGNCLTDADRLISELNIYFQNKLEKAIDNLISQAEQFGIHDDLIESHLQERKVKESFLASISSAQSESERLMMLAMEYDLLNLKDMAEKRFKDSAMHSSCSPKVLEQFMLFDLRHCNYVRAEETMYRLEVALREEYANPKLPTSVSSGGYVVSDFLSKLPLVKSCFFLRRNQADRALEILEHLLEVNRYGTLLNTFLCFIYTFFLDRAKYGLKHLNVGKRVKLRELGMLPPKNSKQDAKAKAAEALIELPQEHVDDLWLELASFFSKHCFVDLSLKCLEPIQAKSTYRYLSLQSNLEFLRGDLDKAEHILEEMLHVGGTERSGEVYLLKATNAFSREYYYEADELISLAKKQNPGLFEFPTKLRLGYLYLREKSYEDAKPVFMSACKDNPRSALSWLGLGISCFRLAEIAIHAEEVEQGARYSASDHLEDDHDDRRGPRPTNTVGVSRTRQVADREVRAAESALRMANIFDPTNSEVWGYTILLSLKDSRKVEQGVELLGHLLGLEVENLDMLFEVGAHSPIRSLSVCSAWGCSRAVSSRSKWCTAHSTNTALCRRTKQWTKAKCVRCSDS